MRFFCSQKDMKSQKVYLVLVLLLAGFQYDFGQEKPNAELFDSFGVVKCDEIKGRSDSFLMALISNPEAVGYVVFYSGIEPIQFSFYERAIKSHIKHRQFPENRIKFITANPVSNFKVEFWLGKNGEKPKIAEREYDLALNSNNSRYLFAVDTIDIPKTTGKLSFFSECNVFIETINFSLMAKYLEANPEINAEIFVYNKKRDRANQFIKLFLDNATKDYKIPLHRVKIGYAGVDEEVAEIYGKVSTVKIWLVPQRKK